MVDDSEVGRAFFIVMLSQHEGTCLAHLRIDAGAAAGDEQCACNPVRGLSWRARHRRCNAFDREGVKVGR